jgi:hypothetical protein
VDQTGDTFSVAFTNFPTGLTLPVGTVTYYDNGTAITSATCPSVSISSAGVPVSTCSYPFPSAVQHFITAQFVPNTTPGGGSAFSSLTSTNSIAVTVSQTGTSLTVTPPASAQINVSATYQATVSLTGSIADTGLTLPTGMVTFTDTTSSPTVSCTASVTPATGVAQCALTPNTAGNTGSSHTITAAYSGDVNFVTSSKTATETVAKATPTIVINSNLQPSVATQTVTFTAIATASSAVNPPTIPTQVNFTVKAGSTAIPCALLAVNSCSATFPASVSGTVTVDASYAGDPNYAPASTPTNGTTYMQSVQNFTPTVTLSPSTSTLSFAQGSPTQSNTNLIDSFNPVTIQFSPNWSPSTPVDGTSVTACSVTGLTTPLPTCAPTANGSGVVVSATSAVAVGNYALTLTVTDKLNPALSQTTAALPFTIVSQTPAVYVDSLGTASVTFTAPANLSLHCGTQVATYQTSTNSYVVNTTLTNIGITCPSTISSSSNSYTFTITAGTQTVARLETGNGGAVLACLGAPFLLMLGLLPASRKLRKSLLHGLAILALGMLLMHATGCGSGGFPARQGTHATDGTYLLDIVNGTSTVAEVPLVIAN